MATEVRDLVLVLEGISNFDTPDGVGGYADDRIPLLGIVIGKDETSKFLVVETADERYSEQYPDPDKVIVLAKCVPDGVRDPEEAYRWLLPDVLERAKIINSIQEGA